MACYHPISAWRSTKGISFRETIDANPMRIACGQCIGCRLERSRQWATRLTHENLLHNESAFITLTYDQENIPSDHSLKKNIFKIS